VWTKTGCPHFGQSVDSPSSDLKHFTWFSHLRNAASQRGGGEGLRLQSQGDQDLCAAAAAGHLMFKTCTEDQTVDRTNKGMTKDSPRFSPWFHSAWRTTGPILRHVAAGGCMKVQTCDNTWEGACAVEQRTKNAKQPALTGPFLPSQT
jgi:hypothetical protein